MTPNEIEVLMHCHCSQIRHPRADAVQETLRCLEENGLIEKTSTPMVFKTTSRGDAHISQLCATAWPTQAWIDERGQVIEP